MKKIVAFILSFALLFSSGMTNLLTVSAAENETQLENGIYSVPVSVRSGTSATSTYEQFSNNIYRNARIEAVDGKYKVTLRLMGMTDEKIAEVKIAKEGLTIYDLADINDQRSGNIDDFYWNQSSYWRTDFEWGVYNETLGYRDLTLMIENLGNSIMIVYPQTDGSTTRKARQIDLSYSQGVKLPGKIEDNNYTWSYVFGNTYNATRVGRYQQKIDNTITEKISALVNTEVEVAVERNEATATFTLTEQGEEQIKSVRKAVSWKQYNKSHTFYPYGTENYATVDMKEGKFQLTFDLTDYNDMVFGPIVEFTVTEGETTTYWYGALRLAEKAVKGITLKDETTGIEFVTTTANVSETAKLKVTVGSAEDEAFSALYATIEGRVKDYRLYDIQVVDEQGNISAVSSKGTLRIPLPEGWTEDDSTLRIQQEATNRVIGSMKDGYAVYDTNQMGQYALTRAFDITTSAENQGLTDGVYTVEWFLRHKSADGSSMSDNVFNKPATLIVDGDTVRLELDIKGVDMGTVTGFLTRMNLQYMVEGADTEGNIFDDTDESRGYIYPVIEQYKRADDGSLYTEQLGAGRQIYYPYYAEKIYIELPKTDAGFYRANFRIPLMDGLTDVDNGSVGHADECAYFIVDYSTAIKQSDTSTEAPISDALSEAILVAEQMKWEEFTPSAWDDSGIEAAIETARTAADGNDSEEKTNAYWTLQTAIDYLTDHYLAGTAAADGLYTADVSLTDGGAAINRARVNVNSSNTTDIRLDTTEIQSMSYYNIDTRDYTEADAIQDSNGTIIGFAYTLRSSFAVTGGAAESVYKNLAVKYTDANGEEHNTWLNIGELTSVSGSDKTSLGTALETANARIEEQIEKPGTYDDAAIAALETAVANALTVYNDPTAFQEEVDAQVTALETALGALAGDTTDLKALIETAKNEAENTDYTSESREELLDLIAEAEELLSGNPSAAEVEAMELKLQTFLDSGLVAVVDKMELQSLIETAEAIENDNYSGYDNLTSILESAKEVLNDDNATAEEVQDMIDALTAAISNLDDSVNKDDLRNLVDQAEGLIADGTYDGCTQESLNLLNSALTAAKAVLEDASASQADVDRHYQMIVDADGAMLKEQDGLADGVYETAVTVLQATDTDGTQTSMAHSAVVDHKAQVVVENGVPTAIRLTFQPLTITGMTGYLETIGYYANYHDSALPSGLTATSASVLSYYTDEEVAETFAYNNGVDPFASYRQTEGSYLKTVEIPVESDGNGGYYTEYWIQVYVPVMASINQASGTQNAKLRLDIDSWTDMTQISGATDTDKASLEQEITNASTLLDEVSGGSYRSEDVSVLEAAVTAGNAFNNNMNIDQTMVDKMVTALQSAQNLFTTQTIDSDKETLSERITEAEEALNREDVTYTDVSRQNLEWVLNAAKVVYGNPEATQTQVSWWAERLRQAIDGLNVISADKTELQAALEAAQERLKDTENYSGASLDTLQSLYDSALAVYENAGSSQTDVDRHASILNYYLNNMVQITESSDVVKDGLYSMLMTASNLAGRDSSFTDVTIKALKAAIEQADAVYTSDDVTQEEVNEQTSKLYYAILALETKPAETPGTGTGDGGSGNDNNDDGNNGGNTDLDIENLADGIYSIYGEMVKTDKTSESMSNAAINHTLKLTVENGKYYITMNFNGLQYAGQYGYLKDLQYFLTGYTTNQYGVPQGDLADVTIDSYQTDEDGNRVSDSFGTDYPDYVTFELIPEALEDGFVPLQVFVPIMESIADGTGTQAVYLKLDWSTLQLTSSDDPDFEDDGNNDNNNDNGDDGNNGGSGLTGGSSLTGGSTLGTSNLGGSSLGSSSLGGSSLGSSSLKSGSGLSSASSVKTDDTTAGYGGFAALLAIGCMAVLAGVMQRRTQKKDKETV